MGLLILEKTSSRRHFIALSLVLTGIALFLALFISSTFLQGCAPALTGDATLTSRTRMELVDWHISGLWIINCPVAWIRIANYNQVPIHDIVLQYNTFDYEGKPLDEGTYTIEESVAPGTMRNFIELYLGLVNLHSDKLSVKLLSVS
jgi:hypothetical protein